MNLKQYIKKPIKNVDEFLKIENPENFDFLQQGEEADRTELTKEIYSIIFPWFDDKKHSGDTLNTYRTIIGRKFYNKFYMLLPRDKQKEILEINGRYHTSSLLEFDFQGKTQMYKQICNNYKIGNFGIFPKGRLVDGKIIGINVDRSKAPYYDYFDLTLEKIKDLYEGKLKGETALEKTLLKEKEYFAYFKTFDEYIKLNFLTSYLDEDGEIKKLSEIETYDEYVRVANDIINKRGQEIVEHLKLEINNKK